MKAGFVACFEATQHAIWLKNFISGLKVVDSINKPIRLFCDNAAVVRFIENHNVTSSNRHIEIKYFYVLNKKEEGWIEVLYMSTHGMIADLLTKGLPSNVFKRHVSKMGVLESLVSDLEVIIFFLFNFSSRLVLSFNLINSILFIAN